MSLDGTGQCDLTRKHPVHKPHGFARSTARNVAGSVNELTERDSRSVDVAIEAEWLMSEIPVQEVLSMKPETAAKAKYGVWGLICGAVIAMIIGFA